ncbi:MAG TPA: malto-oligosyltrehalose synthase [Pyrinomonadaceae bacterium]|nr:malto-oligosyltrehalose synthase [Pyrinomonadaceae bacterium]
MQARIPVSTYRLQFNSRFPFAEARALLDYFAELGISDIYSSPILMARPGSGHGYDVIDHTKINPELGTEEEFVELAHALRERGMGVLMDVVPNHMCIASSENRWWQDVLENGPSSPYARFFDIDWHPPKESFANKVLLPTLGDQYGRVLENQEIKVTYRGGAFFANYYETSLPLAPRSITHVLQLAMTELRKSLSDSHGDVLELESIMTALNHLPPRTERDPARITERRRENLVIKRRLSNLVKSSQQVRHAVYQALMELNGRRDDPRSFDLLEQLLSEQAYRLSYWRVAADEINYRRFFDINELAAVRVEERPVFTAVHEVIFRLLKKGCITGLRIDHVDGLLDPEKYLHDLQRTCAAVLKKSRAAQTDGNGTAGLSSNVSRKDKPFYLVVEKILGHDELLSTDWPIYGTTGYEFMNLLNGVFVDTGNGQAFHELYRNFTGVSESFGKILYDAKKLILRVAMSSELNVLARRLDDISEQHRWSRDFTFNSLQDALSEVIAAFPVYRSYIRRTLTSVSADDRLHIKSAIRTAKRRNPGINASVFDFIESILLLQDPKGLSDAQRAERRNFAMRFQQLTAPVTAKGLEDTAFYRFYPLASLNEVGGEPAIFGVSLERFHGRNLERMEYWPAALSATSTHDTKRGEDVRARINVLSEIPEEWNDSIHLWRELNHDKKAKVAGELAPDGNEEYLIYQTILGAWPFEDLSEEGHAEFVSRIQEYINKALKEAKLHTSWISADEDYERAVRDFIGRILERSEHNQFLREFMPFQKRIARAGLFNSLSQTLLKITAPGVPDFYQGTEVWNLSLVDPDNRRPVNYERIRELLSSVEAADENPSALVEELMREPADDRLKLYLTRRALRARARERELFGSGSYTPLRALGARARHVISFARRLEDKEAVVIAGRFFTRLCDIASEMPVGARAWRDTVVLLGEGVEAGTTYRDALTGKRFRAVDYNGASALVLLDVLSEMPVALLERD